MKTKNFLIAGIVGGIVDFFLGWLFYGMLFKDFFPEADQENMNLTMIFLGCMMYGLFVAYIFVNWAGITLAKSGAISGAIFGFFYGLTVNLFMASSKELDINTLVVDVFISIVMTAIIGAIIAVINGKLKA